jgi:hypothetical protein
MVVDLNGAQCVEGKKGVAGDKEKKTRTNFFKQLQPRSNLATMAAVMVRD